MEKKIMFDVEFESAPVRHVYVTCPDCGSKFDASDVMTHRISYESDISIGNTFICPICGSSYDTVYSEGRCLHKTDAVAVIREVPYPKCADGALKQKTVWE